jgi:hypothetical protein
VDIVPKPPYVTFVKDTLLIEPPVIATLLEARFVTVELVELKVAIVPEVALIVAIVPEVALIVAIVPDVALIVAIVPDVALTVVNTALPPVMLTLLASCVDIVPKPPYTTLLSETLLIVPPVMSTLLDVKLVIETMLAKSSITAFSAGKVTKTSLVLEPNETGAPALLEARIVVLDNDVLPE